MTGLISNKAFLRALIFIAAGIVAISNGLSYGIGTATEMKAGYFPTLIGVLLVVSGIVGVIVAFIGEVSHWRGFAWRPLIALVAGVVAFGLLIRPAGVLIATFALVVAAALASPPQRILETFIVYVVLAAIVGGLFMFGMGYPFALLLPR